MKSYLLAIALVAAAGLLLDSGCSGPGTGETIHTTPAPGTLAVFGGDVPSCSVVSFNVTITGLTLTPQSGSSPVSILPSGTAVTVDFASLMDFTTMFSQSTVAPGIYTSLGITLANPQLTYLDTTTTPASIKTVVPAMSTLSVNLNFSPAITVPSGGSLALQLDFNLLDSLVAGPNNQFSVTPTFTANLASASGSTAAAQFDDLSGLVQSVSTTSTNPAFIGSFTIASPNGQTFTVYANSSTTFAGVSGLSGLTAGTFVEMSAFLDSNTHIVASAVVAEAPEDASNGQAAFTGLISAVAAQSGNATQLTLFVQGENPSVSGSVPLLSLLTVNLVPSTTFGLSAPAANFAGFPLGPANLAPGQRVVVHGTLTGTGAAPSVTARSIFLGLQSVLGTLSTNPSTPVSIASDGVDGGFTLVPCSPLLAFPAVTALVDSQTLYVGLNDLASLTSPGAHPLLLKGLLFYQPSITSFGVESWTVPADVQVATEVHQLPPGVAQPQ